MAFDITPVEQEVAETTLDYKGQSLGLKYYPAAVTPKFMGKLKEAETTGDQDALSNGLGDILSGWDMTRAGDPLPPDADTLSSLPFGLLGEIFRAVMEDSAPGEEGKKS